MNENADLSVDCCCGEVGHLGQVVLVRDQDHRCESVYAPQGLCILIDCGRRVGCDSRVLCIVLGDMVRSASICSQGIAIVV
jgi:hypothetical protein